MRARNVDESNNHGTSDPWDVFTQLAILIIEGRTPGGEKGYHAGPHCLLPLQVGGNRHVCDPNSSMCVKIESYLRQLRLMWGVGVGVTVEVLVAPECAHGSAFTTTAQDTTTAPSSLLTLIEQWNFTIYDRYIPEANSSGRCLVAAVRSFLHFSQLSAWLSVSGGSKPPNVFYRLIVTSPVFCSKFESGSESHTFPTSNLGQDTAIKVMVQSLPRCSQIPVATCPECHKKDISAFSLPSSSSSSMKNFAPDPHQLLSTELTEQPNKPEGNKTDEDLRRNVMRARLGESLRGSRSESPDTQLGESLLDPPHSLARNPRRFQSPSRSGSPSLETPEHIMCRVRTPGPSPGRPPDAPFLPQPFLQPLNPLAWTQARYPFPIYPSFNLPPPSPYPQLFNETPNYGWPSVAPIHLLPESPFNIYSPPFCPPEEASLAPPSEVDTYSTPELYSAPTTASSSNSSAPRCLKQDEVENGASSEGQGTKRKGAYAKESPRTKRESPPHVYYAKEGRREEQETCQKSHPEGEDLLKRKNEEEDAAASKKKDMWPSCSKSGKHLSDKQIAVKKGLKSDRKTSQPCSKLDRSLPSKVNFDLTPKETQEILSVLRQNAPLPPLRIGQHRNSSEETTRLTADAKEIKLRRRSEDVDYRSKLNVKPDFTWCHNKKSEIAAKSGEQKSSQKDVASSNKPCDNSFKKSNYSCSSEDEEPIEDGLRCVEIKARTVIQKTSTFTARSQPQPGTKETQQELLRSPLSLVLSSIQNVSLQPTAEETDKPSVRRVLSFDDVPEEGRVAVKEEEDGESSSTEEDREVAEASRTKGVPSESDKVRFRRSLDSAATLVFHSKTGLPLTSSPAPLRRGTRFDFDSSLNSVAAIRCAFRASCAEVDEEAEKDVIVRPSVRSVLSASAPATVTCSNLLGSFEECVLNGRLEPVSTVHGFSAEIAASGVFCPKHTSKPVTVFFYTLCDNDQISSPYMGHINLGKKGYHVPNKGTVQVTLFNPHGTVVKMFVVMYDLSDMPPNSKTFLRQRTLNMPVSATDKHPDAHQWLRYLIHLRFASSKSGKIYLHTDIRLLIFRKSDADAATLHKNSVPYELRSFTNGPINPKFSPRK